MNIISFWNHDASDRITKTHFTEERRIKMIDMPVHMHDIAVLHLPVNVKPTLS